MNDAVHAAVTDASDHDMPMSEGKRLLRGEMRWESANNDNVFDGGDSHGHEAQHGNGSHDSMSHSEPVAVSKESNSKNSNCASIRIGTEGYHVHPQRPIEEGIYTMNGMR